MADDLDDSPIPKDIAREFTQRFKKHHKPGTSTRDFVIYSVCARKDHIEEHFSSQILEFFNKKAPAEATGVRIYKGTTRAGKRTYHLVFTYNYSGHRVPEELLDHVYQLKNPSFDLDEVAKKHELRTNHLVCQPDCPQLSSLYS